MRSHVFAQVMRHQFEVRDESIIHTPTGAEFAPISGTADSLMVWTGEIGTRLASGEVYVYADVLAAMKTLWSELTLD
jgi:hypothetical protein